ncbi:MAG: S8 family serine peptidase [Deltaproteobacteria bacterium]|nr:S8 family serine peptidase [Deltaproteobacteria bacterium]
MPGLAVAAPWPVGSPVAGPLRTVVHAWERGDPNAALADPAVRPFARRWRRPLLDGDRVLVELHGHAATIAAGWNDRTLAALGVQPVARGWDAWLAWMPLGSVLHLDRALPGLQAVGLPWARRPLAGPHTTQGVALTGADRLHGCGTTGAGARVAVLDDAWHGLGTAVQTGELQELSGKAPYQSPDPDEVHGTACAEIVADLAPQAELYAWSAVTLPELQALLPKLVSTGVHVVSDSSGWTTGYSFADGTGKPCELVAKAASHGIAWVAAAGNEADHALWLGPWLDQDGDGWLDFDGSNRATLFAQKDSYVGVELDWDAYPKTAIDLDLYVCTAGTWPCAKLAVSNATQDGGQAPQEVLDYVFAKSGAVYVGVRVKPEAAAPKGKLGVRVAITGSASLNPWVKAGTVIDPAQCPDAIAVGAIAWDDYQTGPAASYSSRGPTWDGRTKPDLAAPTAVQTSVLDAFEGTSAACPHVAGAIALQMSRAQTTPSAAAAFLIDHAIAMGSTVPDNTFGAGRLDLAVAPRGCAQPARADAAPPTDAEPAEVRGTARGDGSPGLALDAAASPTDGPPATAPRPPATACATGRRSDTSMACLAGLALAVGGAGLRRWRGRADNCRAPSVARA